MSLSTVSIDRLQPLSTNVDDKMFSWSGFWRYITMVSFHFNLSNRSPFSSVLEKKLVITLKALLVLEAAAKVVFIVKGSLIEKSKSVASHAQLQGFL